MLKPDVQRVLDHYAARYRERLGRSPAKKNLDPTLARTLIHHRGDVEAAIRVLDLWFDSPDPWFEERGFRFYECFTAINRFVANGQIKASGTPEYQKLVQKLAAATFGRSLRRVK